jgi:L-amino acid N-acyltransferase YncA
MNIRSAVQSDALGVARVHVYTWQVAYRGIVADTYLESLSVARRGIGRSLWLTARQRLVQRGFLSATVWVLKDNLRAIRFYRAAGFAEDSTSEKEIVLGGQKLREIRYVASLS